MPGTPLKIGPFVGGLNTYSDATAVADNEVVELINFDVDLDGSLVTRPPVVKHKDTATSFKLLGYYYDATGKAYLIGSNINSTATWYYDTVAETWTQITATISATTFVQYANKAWLVAPPGSANPGGTWDPVAGFTAVAAMKKGSAAVVYKERMWIGEGGTGVTSSRLYFSNPANLAVWNSSDFVDVKAGDGQDIIDIILYSDVITVFKQNSTYIFSYDSKPTSGQVTQISNSIGVAGSDCVVEYENNLYLLHDRNVYTVINWNYDKVNIKVPLAYIAPSGTLFSNRSVCVVGDRLLVRFYSTYYVYGLKTRIWSIWNISSVPGKFFQDPSVSPSNPERYFASGLLVSGDMYSFVEGYDGIRTETIDYSIVTKTYDFDSPYTFKRLFWWGADLIAKSDFKAFVYPISYGRKITWAEARTRTWTQARAFTWARPIDSTILVETDRIVSGSNNRTFVKFLKGLRFRQLNLQITGTNDGMITTSPLRLFAISAFVDAKQKVTQEIN